MSMGQRVLVIDNYDSFVYNLVQYLGALGAEPVVFRNDEVTVEDVQGVGAAGLVISPGPGRPESAGISMDLVKTAGRRLPTLGVCLGYQCIAAALGAEVVAAPELMHGKTSMVHHSGLGVLRGLPDPFEATRYHSLVVERTSLPREIEVTAETDERTLMGIRHSSLPLEGVQFHPESILTGVGHRLIENFVAGL